MVADYRAGFRGQDLEDAVTEYQRRWPTGKSPRDSKRGQLIRCSKHDTGIPRYGCASCMAKVMPHKRAIWVRLGIGRTPMMSDDQHMISEAIKGAS